MLAQFLPCLVRSRPSYSIEHGLPGEQSMTLTLMKGQVRTWTDQYHSSQRAVKTSKKTTSPFLHTCSSHWRCSCQRRRWKDVWQKKRKVIIATDVLDLICLICFYFMIISPDCKGTVCPIATTFKKRLVPDQLSLVILLLATLHDSLQYWRQKEYLYLINHLKWYQSNALATNKTWQSNIWYFS